MMVRAPTMIARVDQVYRWLSDKYACEYPVRLRWYKKFPGPDLWDADTFLPDSRSGFVIRMNRSTLYNRWIANNTLLHEWAHCLSWDILNVRPLAKHHDRRWGVAYAKLYSAFVDEGGSVVSQEYRWKRTK